MRKRDVGRVTGWVSHPLFLAASLVLFAVLVAQYQRPPEALDESSPDDQFSAFRAMVILEDLLAESRPHVSGSPLNREIRSRIERQFESHGYAPEVQEQFHCNPNFGSCADVENVIAVKPGSEGNNAILITSHYDGSWAGPGAADDGAGTAAIIEIARMAAQLGELKNDLIFLITDAEEQGLIGAHAFAEYHPLFGKVKAVINIEARGVTGPSMMFETGDGNRSMIRILSRSLERPAANSLAYEVYKRMPNDTDYSVYRNRGVMGVNFAFSEGVALYHSRLDDLNHLDVDSVQHHGQNAWSMLLALADRDIGKLTSREDAAYVDIFSRILVHYPTSAASGITMVLSVLVILSIVLTHKSKMRPMGVVWAILAQFTIVAVFAGGAWLLNWPLGVMVETNPIEHPSPWIARTSVFAMCVLALWIGAKLYAHRISIGEGLLVSWISISGLAFLLDFKLPAASFLALLPMAAFLLGMLVDIVRWRSRGGLTFASLFGFWMATYLAIYFFYLLGSIISFEYTHLVAGPLALMLIAVLPMWVAWFDDPIPDWRPGFVLIGVVLTAAITHQFFPGFTEDRPRGMNIVYRQTPTDTDGLIYLESPGGGVDKIYAGVMGLNSQDIPATYASEQIPYNGNQTTVTRYATSIPSLQLPEPQVDGLEVLNDIDISAGQLRSVRFDLTPPDGSERIVVAFPNNIEVAQARVRGVLAIDGDLESKRGYTSSVLSFPYPGTEPISFEVTFKGALPEGFNVIVRQPLPAPVLDEYQQFWPTDAQAIFRGFRAEVVAAYPFSGD